MDQARDNVTGEMRAAAKSFPSGMKALGDYVSEIYGVLNSV
jgi:hypothetical protein